MTQIVVIMVIYYVILLIYGIIVIYKTRVDEYRRFKLIQDIDKIKDTIGGIGLTEFKKNDLTLEESIQKPTEEESKKGIGKAVGILSDIILNMYENYEFRRHDPSEDDNTSSNGLVMKITGANKERLDKLLELFTIYFRYKLDEIEVAKAMKEEIESGRVIPTGNVIITGVNISSPLRKPDVDIIIEFMDGDKYEKIQESKRKQQQKIDKIKQDKEEK